MSKKPVVPVKRPTKGKGRGKGNCREIKKLMKEVDSIAKGLKEVKGMKGFNGGGWFSKSTNKDVNEVVATNYYDKLRDFFTKPENIANIKRLKEGLVNDVLKTMAGRFKSMLDTGKIFEDAKVAEIVNFVSIISDINNLKQGRLDEVINSGNLNGLPYIDKISTLVIINMLIDVYKSRNKEPQIEGEITFTFLVNTKVLIKKIIDEYSTSNGGKDAATLNLLIEEINRELKYYKEIYRLRDYVYIKGKGGDTDVEKIIEELKGICNKVKEENDFKKFITSSNISPIVLTTGCDDDNLKANIRKVNEIIKKMKDKYKNLEGVTGGLKVNPLYILLFENRNPSNLLKQTLQKLPNLKETLYDLYNRITTYKDIMEEFKNMKEEYIECVKPFFDKSITIDDLKDILTPEKRKEYLDASIGRDVISSLEGYITTYNNIYREINKEFIKWDNIKNNINNNIPADLPNIVSLYNKLCNIKKNYKEAQDIIQEKLKAKAATDAAEEAEEDIKGVESTLNGSIDDVVTKVKSEKAAASAPKLSALSNLSKIFNEEDDERTTANELGGGKLTTKYISTGNFVYILYEKKRIKRCVYAKAKGRGKYCKIKGDYMLLSKLKVV